MLGFIVSTAKQKALCFPKARQVELKIREIRTTTEENRVIHSQQVLAGESFNAVLPEQREGKESCRLKSLA